MNEELKRVGMKQAVRLANDSWKAGTLAESEPD